MTKRRWALIVAVSLGAAACSRSGDDVGVAETTTGSETVTVSFPAYDGDVEDAGDFTHHLVRTLETALREGAPEQFSEFLGDSSNGGPLQAFNRFSDYSGQAVTLELWWTDQNEDGSDGRPQLIQEQLGGRSYRDIQATDGSSRSLLAGFKIVVYLLPPDYAGEPIDPVDEAWFLIAYRELDEPAGQWSGWTADSINVDP